MTEATINLVALCFLTKFEIKMARQKNISNSKPIEKVDGIYDSLMELDRDIKVEKEKNSAIKQSPIRQSLMAAEKNNFQDGGVIVDSDGQYSHPGKNTLIPNAEGRITMKDVKTPVLGIDNQGNSTIMQPEEEYQFQGNSVLEIPITGDINSLVDPTRIKAFKKMFSK